MSSFLKPFTLADAEVEVNPVSTFFNHFIVKVLEAKRAGKTAYKAGVHDTS